MEKYKVQGTIGEGAHGVVLKAKSKLNMKWYSLKRVRISALKKEFPVKVWREISTMEAVKSEYTLQLVEWFSQRSAVVLVTDLMAGDLKDLMQTKKISQSSIKRYTAMLLSGVAHLHSLNIMHRDLKPSNLLISYSGTLKVADFSLSRELEETTDETVRLLSHKVASRWYRAPELLLGSQTYGFEVDTWAIGCIFVEMLNNATLFTGETDVEQIGLLIQYLGTPTEENFPEMKSFPDYGKVTFPKVKPQRPKDLIRNGTPLARHLAMRFLKYSGRKRSTCLEALIHPYFFEPPEPELLSKLQVPKRRQVRHFY